MSVERRDRDITDLARRVSNAVLVGRVSRVDHEKARYRVKAGDIETDWLPFTSARAGGTRTYDSLTVGEQVIAVSPSGDLSQAVIVGALATAETQAATDGAVHRTVFDDGTIIDYNHDTHEHRVALADGGSSTVSVGGMTFRLSEAGMRVEIGGFVLDVSAAGLAMTGGQVTHDGKNIGSDHVHTDVVPGPANTGPPA